MGSAPLSFLFLTQPIRLWSPPPPPTQTHTHTWPPPTHSCYFSKMLIHQLILFPFYFFSNSQQLSLLSFCRLTIAPPPPTSPSITSLLSLLDYHLFSVLHSNSYLLCFSLPPHRTHTQLFWQYFTIPPPPPSQPTPSFTSVSMALVHAGECQHSPPHY